jgi:hypothetical protein
MTGSNISQLSHPVGESLPLDPYLCLGLFSVVDARFPRSTCFPVIRQPRPTQPLASWDMTFRVLVSRRSRHQLSVTISKACISPLTLYKRCIWFVSQISNGMRKLGVTSPGGMVICCLQRSGTPCHSYLLLRVLLRVLRGSCEERGLGNEWRHASVRPHSGRGKRSYIWSVGGARHGVASNWKQ